MSTDTDAVLERWYLVLACVTAFLLFVLGIGTVDNQVVNVVLSEHVYAVHPVAQWPSWLALLTTAAAPLVALRRPWIGFLLAAVVPVAVLAVQHVWVFTSFAGVLAVASVSLVRSVPAARVMAALAVVFPASLVSAAVTMTMPGGAVISTYPEYGLGRIGVQLALYVLGIVLVMAAAQGFRLAATRAEDEARLAARDRALGNDGAALAERARLARDLHDVVAHHVSLIAVRAETAPYTVPDLSEGARTAFASIADDSRRALGELRGVLGVLRRSDGSVDLAPQPGGTDIAGLVADAGSAGPVTYVGDEHLAALPAPQGHVAFRVVQEALTNARRHAPGAPVRITATPGPDGLVVRVSNPVAGEATVVPGAGLTGMRERVEAVGGAFTAEVADGELVVEAVLRS